MKISDSDRIILEMLQNNARARLEDMAFEENVSVATVQRRIRALREQGCIEKEVALARDMDDYQALTHRLFFDDSNSNIKRFRTSVVMDCSKMGLDVPLAD